MTVAQYSKEYKEFIKNALVNQCISEYKRAVFEMPDITGEGEYVNNVKMLCEEKDVWLIVFRKLEPIFRFYSELEQDKISEIIYKTAIFYNENHTFQQYIDTLYNIKTLGSYDFETFCKNMQHENFRNKMIIQYRIDKRNNILKDHIISIVGLHINPADEDDFHNRYEYEEYQQILPGMINAIPYFEYLSKKGWTIDKIEDGILFEQSSNAGERCELKALKMIQQTLFV
jgi:hypothetical protein